MRLREAIAGAAAAFTLNWFWENAQAFLFAGYAGFEQHIWICTVATFGDVVIVAAIFGAVALLWRDFGWHRRASASQYLAAVLIGIAIAVVIEYRALATGRWTYDGMPLIPFTHIGLLPILQMIFLPPLVFRIMSVTARAP